MYDVSGDDGDNHDDNGNDDDDVDDVADGVDDEHDDACDDFSHIKTLNISHQKAGHLFSNSLSRSVMFSVHRLALHVQAHGRSSTTFRFSPDSAAAGTSCLERGFGFAVGFMNACGGGHLGTAPRAAAIAALSDSSKTHAMAALTTCAIWLRTHTM